ncbi:hypothetical protein DFJ58DRAFT_734248 [Suillus subalutaceus]|uniref:uncharacterized protein n=1 Tax=Suillus subalutaceus TaxID=48586 RepID=UPI001B86E318|nr:uncharacterized protein DFJ58DRAFT_734248 [Suillus subalutaceus]KAG1837644.1 hypothetical protein DFJ58DRAFT_734248 [Suillus subalutaceus]
MSSSDESESTTRSPDSPAIKTPLWRSLYVLSTATTAVNENKVTSVPAANNPRPLRFTADNAEYWVNDAGEAFTFRFPAMIDFDGQLDRTGPYFNLPQTGLDLGVLKKMCAQFEIHPLEVEAQDKYPEEAIKCHSLAFNMLNVLHGEAEEARNSHEC